MAGRSTLDRAKKFLRSRRFSRAIKLLEGVSRDGVPQEYRRSFDFFYTLAVACMYQGDIGGANDYLNKARSISMLDPRLFLAQGALLLRRGDTARAVEYYLNALDIAPKNRTARKALAFIRDRGDSETITRWVETGRIRRFYPPLGPRPAAVKAAVLVPLAAAAAWVFFFVALPARNSPSVTRGDLGGLSLTADESRDALETDLSSGAYRYILSAREITGAYAAALRFYENYRDNAAQVEVNRILNSNASAAVRQKARLLMNYFTEPTFDSIRDTYPYRDVAADPALYQDCFVVWSGRVSNLRDTETGLRCDLLVGYEKLISVEGVVPLVFESSFDLDPALSVQVLGRVALQDKKLILKVKSVYQPRQ
ncbi:MAG: tetratricopeptide repeat protein [Spirochaetaceae bacterium]|jgi:tetratricopeptide (TPR) repeat protein|nr:tetratricopeptide repeat protein [Spirochaetaceae bacterium]